MNDGNNKIQKVLFINPPSSPFTEAALLCEPIDLLGVATYVASLGHTVKVVDFDREQKEPSALLGILKQEQPQWAVIAFDYHIPLHTPGTAANARQLSELADAQGCAVVLAGKVAKQAPEDFLHSEAVSIVPGELELALRDLLNLKDASLALRKQVPGLLLWEAGQVISTAARRELVELDSLPIPNRRLLDLGRYLDLRTMLSSRGCSEACSFCPVPGYWGKWRSRSSDLVLAEIEMLVAEHQASKILLLDDHAAVDSARLEAIARGIIEHKIKCRFGCLATVRSFKPATFELMAQAGFAWVHFGAESACDATLKAVQKRQSVAELRAAIKGAQALGYRVRTSWILDLPGTAAAGLAATRDLILETEPEELRIHYLCLRPGASLAQSLFSGAKLSEKDYLHAARPHCAAWGVDEELVLRYSAELTEALTGRGYRVVAQASDWPKVIAEAQGGQKVRFISFCPARYGLSW